MEKSTEDDGEEERMCGKEEMDVWESEWKEREG